MCLEKKKRKWHASCEIENFLESHPCKLGVSDTAAVVIRTSNARATRYMTALYKLRHFLCAANSATY